MKLFGQTRTAFTLLEVMIAITVFFIVAFAILELVTRSLVAARALQQSGVDAGFLAAELSLTNSLTEGTESGDFGDLYPDYSWTRDIYEVSSNGLFQVDFIVHQKAASRSIDNKMSVLMFKPYSTPGFGRR